MRVVYSFPHPLGGQGIGTTAWQHVRGLALAGVEVLTVTPRLVRPFEPDLPIRVLSWLGPVRPRMVGRQRVAVLHDALVARVVARHRPDLVHSWPGAVLRTATAAARLGVPSVREAPSPYTRVAVATARRAWAEIGLEVPQGHFHNPGERSLAEEDREFRAVDAVLTGSEQAASSFADTDLGVHVLVNPYGFDPDEVPSSRPSSTAAPKVLFVGRCEPTKGIHVLLRAWSAVPDRRGATLVLCGEFPAAVRERLAAGWQRPDVNVRGNVPHVVRQMSDADVLVLPSYSEGSALVGYEALGAGVVPVLSTACGVPIVDGVDGVLHHPGDADALTGQLAGLLGDPAERERLRSGGRVSRPRWTWERSGARLAGIYASLG